VVSPPDTCFRRGFTEYLQQIYEVWKNVKDWMSWTTLKNIAFWRNVMWKLQVLHTEGGKIMKTGSICTGIERSRGTWGSGNMFDLLTQGRRIWSIPEGSWGRGWPLDEVTKLCGMALLLKPKSSLCLHKKQLIFIWLVDH